MAHEEHNPRYSNGGRSLKKLKQNKAPQRGMGVAQLEKIILEEKQSKDVAISTPNSTSFRPRVIPLPPPLPPNHRPSIPKTGSTNHKFKPMHTSRTRLWIGNPDPDLYLDPESGLEYCGYAVPSPTNLGQPIWPSLPNITQRSQFLQPCSSSMVNVSSSPTTSVVNVQMEPPSNQSYCSNKYSSIWSEEDKIVGMKRSYPFSVENIPIPSFNCKFSSAYVFPNSRLNGSTSCSNGGITSLTSPNRMFREKHSSLGANSNKPKLKDENYGLTKDFLTLAPPQVSPRSTSSNEKLPPLSVGDSTLPPYEGQTRDSYGEAGEHVDLNLKL